MAKYRALYDLALRKSADPKSPLYEEWYEWPAGTVFDAPPNLNIAVGLAAGKFEPADAASEVDDGEV